MSGSRKNDLSAESKEMEVETQLLEKLVQEANADLAKQIKKIKRN